MVYPKIETITEHIDILLNSYYHHLGKDLITRTGSPLQDARSLTHADCVVLSCDAKTDPILNYANLKALELWEWDWSQMIRTTAKETAEPDERSAREQLLHQVKSKGYADNYTGVRISRTGKRFLIKQACVWNLMSSSGDYVGQAATFTEWEYL